MPAQLERDQHPSVFSFLDFMDHAGLWLMQDTIHRVCENANTSNRVAAYLRTLTKALPGHERSPANIFKGLVEVHSERLKQGVSAPPCPPA